MTEFEKKVYKATELIPKGKVSTYKDIAQTIGSPKSSRAVGNALNKNPNSPKVPCHRVIKSNGEIGGYAKGSKSKTKILQREGVRIRNNYIDLDKFKAQIKKHHI